MGLIFALLAAGLGLKWLGAFRKDRKLFVTGVCLALSGFGLLIFVLLVSGKFLLGIIGALVTTVWALVHWTDLSKFDSKPKNQ